MPSLTLDGKKLTVPEGTTVIQAADGCGAAVPRYCYHPGLSVAGNCRICLVDVEKSPKLQIACNTPVTEGMVVHTNSPKAVEGRKAVLEFLLANHPLDCPVCDQSGECDLQNFYMRYGLYDPRFREAKVKKKKAVELGEHVMLDQERCILCSRCVRFTDEVTKTGEFGIFNRGERAELGLYPGKTLDNPYSGNVVDICPVGALTERETRFKVRVWYLASTPTVCGGCSRGCNADLHHVKDRPHLNDGARAVRLKPRPNPEVNQWWLCDEGRYGIGPLDRGRLLEPRLAGRPAGWDELLAGLAAALPKLGKELGVVTTARLTVEELWLAKELFGGQLGARLSAPPAAPGKGDELLLTADRTPNRRGAELLGLGGPSAESLVEDALAGRLRGLWVLGEDLSRLVGPETLERLAEKLELFVYQGPNENPAAAAAPWLVPGAAYVEKDGTFVNFQGRAQRVGKAYEPLGASRPDWAVLAELGRRLGLAWDFKEPEEVLLALGRKVAAFRGLTYEKLGTEGLRLGEAAPAEAAPA